MMELSRHNGDFGIGFWVECVACQRQPGQGSFAIRSGESHDYDRRTNRHLHHDCAEALVRAGEAVYVDGCVTLKAKAS